ncbi:MAG: SCO family protein [Verrucomicrobiales bacterium]|nr:SCO family protein [Verrucomicrobiales bacterium]
MKSIKLVPVLLVLVLAFSPLSTIAEQKESSSRWGANYFPDHELTDHKGKKVKFFTDLLKDKIVVINFIYTSCPDTCPLETSRLREVYALLEERMGKDIFFYSITIDPENDSVAVLKDYADRWDVGDGWKFLTGNEANITELRKKLGLLSSRDSVNLSAHQVNMVMGNQKTGRWIHRTPFDSAVVLAEHLGTWLNNYRNVKTSWNDYEDAPELRPIDGGEYIFRTRCASCHTIGGGDVHGNQSNVAGPDLLAVGDRRDPDWLKRWVREPDVMLAEKDPLAMALLEQYNGVVMPNFRLSEQDVDNVLAFIKRESDAHLKGRAGEFQQARKPANAGKPKEDCPGCSKRAQETGSSTRGAPRTWNADQRRVLPNTPQK